VHKILDKGKPEELLVFDKLDIADGNLEYLIGLDVCAYRLPCKTILGDRSIIITKKRYNSKVQMLDVYREAMDNETTAERGQEEKKEVLGMKSTIFDLDGKKDERSDDKIGKLRSLLQEAKE
jgi:hypothetical protein